MTRTGWTLVLLAAAGCAPAAPGLPAPGLEAPAMAPGQSGAAPEATPTPTYARVIDRRRSRPAADPGVPPPPPIADGAPSFAGLVVGVGEGPEAPLAGAVVRVADGRYAISDEAGRFVLPGAPPANGVYLAACQGFVASSVVGFPTDAPLVLHLRARAAVAAADPPADASFPVEGTVLDPAGRPAEGVSVTLGNAAGSTAVPALTGADGRFTLDVFAPPGGLVDGTLIAAGPAGQAVVTGVAVAGGQALAPVALLPAAHHVRLALDGSAVAAPLSAAVVLVAPDGTRLALEPTAGGVDVAPLPGVRFAFRMEANDGASGTTSLVRREDLALDFGQPETVVTERLLAPPVVAPPAGPLEGQALAWGAVDGATGYRLAVSALAGGGLAWETYASTPAATLRGLPASLSGPYEIVVTAWDEASQALRTVAMAERRLKILPLGASYRSSTTRVRVD